MNKSFLNDVIVENSEREVDDSFCNFLVGVKKIQTIREGMSDNDLSKELVDYIDNDNVLSEQVPAVKKTLYKHWKRGEYSSTLAERAWNRLVTEASQKYASDIGKEPRLWNELFTESIRKSIVESFESGFYNDLKKGKINMEELFNE